MAAPDHPRRDPRREQAPAPPEFTRAVAQLHAATTRPEVLVEQMPAPQRIAPHAAALSADVVVDGEETGSGRLVLLHDPAGNDAWDGTFRCVAYARAEIDPELVQDPVLAEVGWSWLVEALDAHGAAYSAPSGSVTCVASQGFGGMAEEPQTAQLEIRASWSPTGDITPHVEAWSELLCTAVGLPPVPEGVAVMPSRRAHRGPA
ncbi:DUF3000 domain-containing protein [Nocardioides aequoreus]|uniref:DUF3000 domain-containing protein n=1 Tax=Nocardioides aequoreus TaxID=397278 RepID=UPI00068ACFF9|nr:DUF3000 domain-containing protein [Nocardioides aequoreus]